MAIKPAIQLLAIVLDYRILAFLLSTVISGLPVALLMGTVVAVVGKDNPKFVGLACINIVVATN